MTRSRERRLRWRPRALLERRPHANQRGCHRREAETMAAVWQGPGWLAEAAWDQMPEGEVDGREDRARSLTADSEPLAEPTPRQPPARSSEVGQPAWQLPPLWDRQPGVLAIAATVCDKSLARLGGPDSAARTRRLCTLADADDAPSHGDPAEACRPRSSLQADCPQPRQCREAGGIDAFGP
jgi:hypothetical protein